MKEIIYWDHQCNACDAENRQELNVGDIRKLDPNIHAGVKYMRWMIDNYYGDEPMTALDKAKDMLNKTKDEVARPEPQTP